MFFTVKCKVILFVQEEILKWTFHFWYERNITPRSVCTSMSFKVTFRGREQNVSSREKNTKLFLDDLPRSRRCRSRYRQLEPKKRGKRGKKKKRARAGYSRGYSLNDSTMLGHSSKRYNASSMTGNAQFRWNQVRRDTQIKHVTSAMKSFVVDTVFLH